MSGEKTEEPTQKKLDPRKKGQSPKSQDVNAAVSLVGLMVVLIVLAETMFDRLSQIMEQTLQQGLLADERLFIGQSTTASSAAAALQARC